MNNQNNHIKPCNLRDTAKVKFDEMVHRQANDPANKPTATTD